MACDRPKHPLHPWVLAQGGEGGCNRGKGWQGGCWVDKVGGLETLVEGVMEKGGSTPQGEGWHLGGVGP